MDFAHRLADGLESKGIMIPKTTVDRLARFRQKISELSDAMTIPRWARIALAARTVRRVQPLLLASWPEAPKKFVQAVENAVAEAELAAEQGAVTPDQTAAGMAAMDAYASRPMDVGAAGDVAYAAAHASFAARSRGALRATFVIETAMWAVSFYEKNDSSTLVDGVLDAIWEDLRNLLKMSKAGNWNDKTPVSVDIFGPMWVKPPKNWPKAPKSPPPRKPRKPTTLPASQQLALPRDLVKYLQAGQNLNYDPGEAECGLVVLKPYTHLRLGQCRVRSDGTSMSARDPHRGEDGDYVVRTVELISECDAYDPEGILTWFPDFRTYGCWDADHHTALVFPKTKWADIVADPAPYLGAQWNGPSEISKHMAPWKHGEFKKRN